MIVLLTDGQGGDPCSGQTVNNNVGDLTDILLFTVNVGSGASQSATACVADKQFNVSDFAGLGSVVDTLITGVCA